MSRPQMSIYIIIDSVQEWSLPFYIVQFIL